LDRALAIAAAKLRRMRRARFPLVLAGRASFALLLALACGACGSTTVPPASPAVPAQPATGMRVADLPIPGPPAFVAVARDIVDVAAAIDPSTAANAGLFDDAIRVPS
jgi:hypothetical protein